MTYSEAYLKRRTRVRWIFWTPITVALGAIIVTQVLTWS